mmetsp:Transcript_17112/g.49613  ORF Transcript_17112/g.49613 Transcript_17112/m.49613 type:complete len:215 (-) Transcript_17112:627-1271(-)
MSKMRGRSQKPYRSKSGIEWNASGVAMRARLRWTPQTCQCLRRTSLMRGLATPRRAKQQSACSRAPSRVQMTRSRAANLGASWVSMRSGAPMTTAASTVAGKGTRRRCCRSLCLQLLPRRSPRRKTGERQRCACSGLQSRAAASNRNCCTWRWSSSRINAFSKWVLASRKTSRASLLPWASRWPRQGVARDSPALAPCSTSNPFATNFSAPAIP